MDESVARYLARIGRRGGRATSARKRRAVTANLEKARAAKRRLRRRRTA